MDETFDEIAKRIAAKRISSGFVRDLAIYDELRKSGFYGTVEQLDSIIARVDEMAKEDSSAC